MKLSSLLTAAALTLASTTALAQGPNYNYIQGGYQMMTGGDNPDGLFIDGSYQVNDKIYITGGYEYFSESVYEVSRLTARGGFIHTIDSNMDIYAEGGLARSTVEVEVPHFNVSTLSWTTRTESDSSTDLLFEGGVRAMVMPKLEARGALRIVTGDYDETYLIGEGVYQFSPELSAVGGLARMTEAEEFRIQMGLRYAF